MVFQRPSFIKRILDSGNYQQLIKKNHARAVVLLSGGIDSTVALYLTKSRGIETIGLEFFYNGRPKIESERIKKIAEKADIPIHQIKYPSVRLVGRDNLIKVEHLEESNNLYYLLAGAFAKQIKATGVIAGQIADDWIESNDVRAKPTHYRTLNSLLREEYSDTPPIIETPLIYLTKTEVVKMGLVLNAPLDLTWSCPNNENVPCSTCSQCRERTKAFKLNNLNNS